MAVAVFAVTLSAMLGGATLAFRSCA